MRVHGESGIPEGSYPFWKTLFEAISGCGRKIEIDMHAKGVNQTMIDIAMATGMPVKLGAKYSAEHQSLGYNQADIRAAGNTASLTAWRRGVFSVSNGARLFTRYGYADFFQQGSRYKCCFACGRERSAICSPPIRRWPRLSDARPFLRRGRAGHNGAADLQGPRRFRPTRRPLRLRGRIAQSRKRRLEEV